MVLEVVSTFLGWGDLSSGVKGRDKVAAILSMASATLASISFLSLHPGGTVSDTIRMQGIPLLDAADLASLIKALLHSVAVGLFLSSITIA